MIPVAVGLGAFLLLAALLWIVRGTQHARMHKKRVRAIGQSHGIASGFPSDRRQITGERDERAAAVIRDAERALAQARLEGDAIVAAAETKAAEMQSAAERTARAIIHDAEEKAGELLEAAELQATEARKQAAREREAAQRAREQLSELIRQLLDEVRRPPAALPPEVEEPRSEQAR